MQMPSPKLLGRVRETVFPQFNRLSFSDLVLLNQLSNDDPTLGPSEHKQLMEQMTLRHDQLELKANCMDYKKFTGVDTVHEFVQALKHLSFEPGIDIVEYNPMRQGYLHLLDLKVASKPATIVLENRFDVLSDGVTVNGYE